METNKTAVELADEDARCVLVAIVVNEFGDVINHYRVRFDRGDYIGEDDACSWNGRFDQYLEAVGDIRSACVAEAQAKRGSAYMLAGAETSYDVIARNLIVVGEPSPDVPRVAIRRQFDLLRRGHLMRARDRVRKMLTTSLSPRIQVPWRLEYGTVSRADLLAYAQRRLDEIGKPLALDVVDLVLEVEFDFLNARGLATALVCEPTPEIEDDLCSDVTPPIKAVSTVRAYISQRDADSSFEP